MAATDPTDIDLAISLLDLTSLNSTDTPERIRELCATALDPDPRDPTCPRPAAVCVYPDLVEVAAEALAGSGIVVAAAAGGFPFGRAPLSVKVAEIDYALGHGADEIDTVIDRGAVLSGRDSEVVDELTALKQACGNAPLKVILETGELGSLDTVRHAARLALTAGADVVKTSTGKGAPGATVPATRAMFEVAKEWRASTSKPVGVKVAGGVRTTTDALTYLLLAREAFADPIGPHDFRIGASSLLSALVASRHELGR